MNPIAFRSAAALLRKEAKVHTKLQAHQQRVVDRISEEDQPGLVVAHGLGSGKTLTSIAAQDALGMDSTVVVPAALQANYRKEQKKHLRGPRQNSHIVSMQRVARQGSVPAGKMLIVDEAHRARSTGSKTFDALKKNKSKKRLLLTGSPFYNHPSDISPLVNIAGGGKILPERRDEFEAKYISQVKKSPGLIGWLKGVQPGVTPTLNPLRRKELKKTLNKWVDYYEGSKENYPTVERQNVKVPMTEEQLHYYDSLMKQAPAWVRYKIRNGLPPTKKELGDLNAFLGGVRQISNTTAPYHLEGDAQAPKIEKAYQELKKHLDKNPRAKGVVYSNFLDAGIEPYKAKLRAGGIPFGEFTGQMDKKERDQLVQDYNANKIRTLLLSSAGGEGLDLKGTRLMQVLEPHWNDEKLRQVEGRGVRFGSHADLPEDERNVLIQRYQATRPRSSFLEKMKLRNPGLGVDEYLTNLSQDKEHLNHQFRELLKRDQARQ
jgi:superfamily II DNA or RNA helicase